MIPLFFTILVVLGFFFQLSAQFGNAWGAKAAWTCWAVASLLWALAGGKL